MAVSVSKWDAADYLDTKEDIDFFLEEAVKAAYEDNNPDLIVMAIGAVARSKGMAQIAQAAGVNRETLYRSLSDRGNPSFSTVFKVLDNLGWQLSVTPRETVTA